MELEGIRKAVQTAMRKSALEMRAVFLALPGVVSSRNLSFGINMLATRWESFSAGRHPTLLIPFIESLAPGGVQESVGTNKKWFSPSRGTR